MTRQITECILIDGQRRQMMSDPLGILCDRHYRSIHSRDEGTHCHRGYVGVWAIRGTHLILDEVCDPSHIEEGDEISEIGLRRYTVAEIDHVLMGRKLPVHARWVTGHLKLPYGPELVGRMGWGAIFQYFRVLSIEKGVVVRDRMVDMHAQMLRCLRDPRVRESHADPNGDGPELGSFAWFEADPDLDEGAYGNPIMGFESALIRSRG